jgi:hypothetical protein
MKMLHRAEPEALEWQRERNKKNVFHMSRRQVLRYGISLENSESHQKIIFRGPRSIKARKGLLSCEQCEPLIELSRYVDIDDWPEGTKFTSAGTKDEEIKKNRLMWPIACQDVQRTWCVEKEVSFWTSLAILRCYENVYREKPPERSTKRVRNLSASYKRALFQIKIQIWKSSKSYAFAKMPRNAHTNLWGFLWKKPTRCN